MAEREARRPGRGWRWAATALVIAGLATAAAPGCLGPQAVKQTRLRYNEAYRDTNDQQILLNIVRLRYADSPVFVDLPSITSQFEATGRGGFTGGIGNMFPGTSRLGEGELFFRDAPTLSYHPRDGKEVARPLATPLTAEALRLVVGTASVAPFLLMAVDDVNDVPNAPKAKQMIPDGPADNAEFRGLIGLWAALQGRDGIELAVETREVPISDPIPDYAVRGQDLAGSARAGYVFRRQAEDQYTLKKRQRNLGVHVRPREQDSFEARELVRRLRLTPGLDTYLIRSELLDDEDDDDLGGPVPLPSPLGGDDTIFLNMRSILEIMAFLSKGVCVPAEHVASGEAPTVRDDEGRPFDWTCVTAGLFSVRSGKKPPRDAEVAVPYRGRWFWVERTDVASRATLATLELLLSLQESGGEEAGPLLTLPVGG